MFFCYNEPKNSSLDPYFVSEFTRPREHLDIVEVDLTRPSETSISRVIIIGKGQNAEIIVKNMGDVPIEYDLLNDQWEPLDIFGNSLSRVTVSPREIATNIFTSPFNSQYQLLLRSANPLFYGQTRAHGVLSKLFKA